MKITRRDFVKIGVKGTLGGIVIYSVPQIMKGVLPFDGKINLASAEDNNFDLESHYWGFICDNEKCIGCGRCVVACKQENNVPEGPEHNRTWVERYAITREGETYVDSPESGINGFSEEPLHLKYKNHDIRKSFFVPKLCNQCDNPPCVTVCPVGATYKTEDGITLIDQEHCIGCGYCLQACPYGARYFLPDTHVVDKCTWCYHRIHRGLMPACVEVCPVEARLFGDLLDPLSKVNSILTERRVYTLKPELGTESKVYYIGFEKGVL